MYVATTKDEGNAADGHFSSACKKRLFQQAHHISHNLILSIILHYPNGRGESKLLVSIVSVDLVRVYYARDKRREVVETSPKRLLVLPGWFSLLQKGLEPFKGIIRLHQAIQVDFFNGFKAFVHVIIEPCECRLFGQFQNDST